MRLVVTGGTGFLGRALVRALAADGHDVVVLSRHARSGSDQDARVRTVAWQPDGTAGAWASEIDGADAVVNLAGAGIADRRWTAARKREIRESRVLATRSVVAALGAAARRPAVLVSGSAIGYYGVSPTHAFDEDSPAGYDFLADTCALWEQEARAAQALGCRVVLVRTGVALAPDGGALAKMLPPFRWFVGGQIGDGRQWMSWIDRDDWIALVKFAIADARVSGPLNAVAPEPTTNRGFSKVVARALHRPCWLTVQPLALKIGFGEMATAMLLNGQHVEPARAVELGFVFRYPTLPEAAKRWT